MSDLQPNVWRVSRANGAMWWTEHPPGRPGACRPASGISGPFPTAATGCRAGCGRRPARAAPTLRQLGGRAVDPRGQARQAGRRQQPGDGVELPPARRHRGPHRPLWTVVPRLLTDVLPRIGGQPPDRGRPNRASGLVWTTWGQLVPRSTGAAASASQAGTGTADVCPSSMDNHTCLVSPTATGCPSRENSWWTAKLVRPTFSIQVATSTTSPSPTGVR